MDFNEDEDILLAMKSFKNIFGHNLEKYDDTYMSNNLDENDKKTFTKIIINCLHSQKNYITKLENSVSKESCENKILDEKISSFESELSQLKSSINRLINKDPRPKNKTSGYTASSIENKYRSKQK